MKVSSLPFYPILTASGRSVLQQYLESFSALSGQPVRENGTEPYGMIYVEEGTLSVLLLSEDGREVSIRQLRKGDYSFLSASRLITGLSFDVTMEAESDSKICALSNASLELLLKNNPAFALFVRNSISENFSDTVNFLQNILFRTIEQRLAIFLYTEMSAQGTTSLSLTHEQIARHIGSAREVVSRTLKHFSLQGIVSVSRGCVTVLNKEALKRVSRS